MNHDFWNGRSVFVTGHTGFKGSWLAFWLHGMGARVHGYALHPPTQPSLFDRLELDTMLQSHRVGDVTDAASLQQALQDAQPEIVFHLAAQPLVRASYAEPVRTYETNVMGTVNLLEGVRTVPSVQSVVVITTDKCYHNREWVWGYREDEPLGGHDPYSSSKACAELVAAAYRSSFMQQQGIGVATARAGNVIGGGDWALDRLVPDCIRAIEHHQTLRIRSPHAVRPWQHVLEPLAGYLMLAERLCLDGDAFADAWNFGPGDDGKRTVEWILNELKQWLPDLRWECEPPADLHEAHLLSLDSSKARSRCGWQPRWSLREAVSRTADWYTAYRQGVDMQAFTRKQIEHYETGEEGDCLEWG